MTHIRGVETLPLAPSDVDLLVKNGFRTVNDLDNLKLLDLASELGTSPEIANRILKSTRLSSISTSSGSDNIEQNNKQHHEFQKEQLLTVRDVLLQSSKSRPIITFCKSIDSMLGGGVQTGQITEFCGVPGIGKTQLGMQLALNVQIPEILNGNGGEAVYIDTEGSFMAERLAEMAQELSVHLNRIFSLSSQSQNSLQKPDSLPTKQSLLESVHVFRAHEQTETIAIINMLTAFIKEHPRVKIIIIDSIAFHFRYDLNDVTSRNRLLSTISQSLHQLAYANSLAVVVVNHVTTRFVTAGDRQQQQQLQVSRHLDPNREILQHLIPALGEQWSHCVTNRIILHWEGDQQRVATLVKCPNMPTAKVFYRVCEKGIRDVESKRKFSSTQLSSTQGTNTGAATLMTSSTVTQASS